MGLQNKFVDNDSYVQSTQTRTAANNDVEFHVSITESTQVRATSLNIINQSVTRTPATPFPTTSNVGQQTIGVALSGIDQPPVEPDDREIFLKKEDRNVPVNDA